MYSDRLSAVQYTEKPYKIIKADSGAIKFSVSINRLNKYYLHLLFKKCPHEEVYTIILDEQSSLIDRQHQDTGKNFVIPGFYNHHSCEFWLTWFDDVICFGKSNEPALLSYPEMYENDDKMIGFVKFDILGEHGNFIEWDVESPPLIYAPMKEPERVDGGDLRWVKMTSGSMLPVDALIGGLEVEPIYIARASHNGSLCPGKYLKSKQLAFISWGEEEISKNEFEILCGYDAMWIMAKCGEIPENALIAGHSEVRQEPLYIGRAWVENDLIVGKVHLLYDACYLPYRSMEVEKKRYEILVTGNKVCRGERSHLPCYFKMVMQPCI